MAVPCIVIDDGRVISRQTPLMAVSSIQLQCTRATTPFTLIDLRDPTLTDIFVLKIFHFLCFRQQVIH